MNFVPETQVVQYFVDMVIQYQILLWPWITIAIFYFF